MSSRDLNQMVAQVSFSMTSNEGSVSVTAG